MDATIIEVKDGNDRFRILTIIQRVPRQHSGWESVTYQNKRYQLFGGVRVNHFIDIANPLKRRPIVL